MDDVPRDLLFICSGNICRSPLAEAIARAALNGGGIDAGVASAGTASLTGQPADPAARAEAQSAGLSLDGHRAQPITRDLIGGAALIVCVTDRHRDFVRQFFPSEIDKIVSFDDVTGLGDIPDPYGGRSSEFARTRQLLERGMPKIVEELRKRRGRDDPQARAHGGANPKPHQP